MVVVVGREEHFGAKSFYSLGIWLGKKEGSPANVSFLLSREAQSCRDCELHT